MPEPGFNDSMTEQLELFGDEFFPEKEGKEPKEIEQSVEIEKPEEEKTKEGQIMVWIGYDEELTLRASKLLYGLGLQEIADGVTVNWNKRMRSAAGRAHYQTCLIDLNPRLQLLPEPKKTKEIEDTFLHELAHLVAFGRNRGRRIQPHGAEWKRACADLGIPGEDRCHDLDLGSRRMKRKFVYECPACKTSIPRVRRIKRAVACHSCCKTHSGGKFDSRFRLVEKKLPR